jgi:hypothetical protein
MNSPDPTSRQGAQPGNTNAVKHGLYSPRFTQIESGDPQKVVYTGVNDEIEMLRKSIRRIVEMSEAIHSLPEALDYLRILALASMSLSRLVRAQKLIADSEKGMSIGRAVPESGAASGDANSSEVSEEVDPTIEWAKCDPPDELRPWYSPKFDPSEYGEKGYDDEEGEHG